MIAGSLRRSLPSVIAAVLVLVAVPRAASDKTIFVSALDDNNTPVKGLTLADFRLREDGVDREISEVKAAHASPHISPSSRHSAGHDEGHEPGILPHKRMANPTAG